MKLLRTAPRVPVLSAVVAVVGLAASVAAEPMARRAAPQQPAAQQPTARPRPLPAMTPVNPGSTRTIIVLLETKGDVQIRRPENISDDPKAGWERPRAGTQLPEGVQVRTGLSGAARLQIGATQSITVDKFTSLTVRVAANDAGTERTRVELPLGRLGIDVDSTRIANDVQIATPQTTLAVTGTTFVIEHSSAFGTLAKGTETNTGSFNMVYINGAVATVTGSQESSANAPSPAVAQQQKSQIDTADPNARESDELAVAERAAGSGEALGLSLGISPSATDLITSKSINEDPPAAIAAYLAFDQARDRIVETDLSGARIRTLVESVPAVPGAPFSGLAAIEGAGGTRTLYLLRSDLQSIGDRPTARNRLYSFDVNNPVGGFGLALELGGSGKVLLQGLGSIGPQLFAHGFEVEGTGAPDSVYEIVPTAGTVVASMALPGVAIGGMGGSNDRGSVFLSGRLALADGSDQHVFLEVDPRTNYFIGASGGTGMEFVPTEGSTISAGLDASTIDNISGLAVVDGILIMSATALVGGVETNVVLQYDPGAANTSSSPRLRRVEAVAEGSFINALASERGTSARASRVLVDAPGPIDLVTINPIFARMGYGEEALVTNVLERMVGNEIITTSRDPAGCAASGALDALPSILRRHVDKTSGVGRTVWEFRDSLPFMHPCGSGR